MAARVDAPPRLDARAWLLWVGATAVLITMLRHPVYIALILLVVQLVDWRRRDANLQFDLPLGRLGVVMVTVSTLFNALFVHVGAIVLLRLPAAWPLIGGAITLEAAVVGAVNGLVLLTLLALFLAFNHIVPIPQLLRLTPGALVDVGLIVLIALTYLPETTQHLRRIQAAQAIRGHRMQGWRDWRPIAIPLLVGGLERSLNVAETMVARGFGHTDDRRQPVTVRLALAAGLAMALVGATLAFWQPVLGWAVLFAGCASLVVALWWNGRQIHRTTYRRQRWGVAETAVVVAAGVALSAVWWRSSAGASLTYSPYPALTIPTIDFGIAAALLLMVLPALWPFPADETGAS